MRRLIFPTATDTIGNGVAAMASLSVATGAVDYADATGRRLKEQSGDGRRDCCSVTDGAIRQPGGGLPLLVRSASVAHHGRFRGGGELRRASGRTRAECCFRRRAVV